jgi:hypothetical protein
VTRFVFLELLPVLERWLWCVGSCLCLSVRTVGKTNSGVRQTVSGVAYRLRRPDAGRDRPGDWSHQAGSINGCDFRIFAFWRSPPGRGVQIWVARVH